MTVTSRRIFRGPAHVALLSSTVFLAACGSDSTASGGGGAAGAVASGGSAVSSGGATTGGATAGGAATTGGTASGGATIGGAATGGSAAGGSAAGGASPLGGAAGSQAGGSGGSQSSGGAAAPGGSGGALSAGCAGKNYKLCEDFETGTVGSAPTGWTRFNGYGTASAQDQTLSTEQFHAGAQALKSISGKKGVSRVQKSLSSLGATATKHWGRIFYKVQVPTPSVNFYLHVTFVSLMGASENRIVDTVQQSNSAKHQWLFNNPNDQGGKASAYDWTYDAGWHCAEWYVDVGTKSYRFFSDSSEVQALTFVGQDNQMSNYTSIIVGATHYQDGALPTPFVIWFDDLAVDDARVGCQ